MALNFYRIYGYLSGSISLFLGFVLIFLGHTENYKIFGYVGVLIGLLILLKIDEDE